MADDGKPTFDQLRDALMPPGTDKDALWAALKNAHRTGGHVPGRPAPDISFGPSPGLADALRTRPCMACANYHPSGTPCPARAQTAIPADPFTKGSVAAAGLAEMYEDMVASGIPVGSVERILGAMLATYGMMTGDDEP